MRRMYHVHRIENTHRNPSNQVGTASGLSLTSQEKPRGFRKLKQRFQKMVFGKHLKRPQAF
jgi:hypothetical protein